MVLEHARSHREVLCHTRGLDRYLQQAGNHPPPDPRQNDRAVYHQITLNNHRLIVILPPSLIPTFHLRNKTQKTGGLYPGTPILNKLLPKVKVKFPDNRLSMTWTRMIKYLTLFQIRFPPALFPSSNKFAIRRDKRSALSIGPLSLSLGPRVGIWILVLVSYH